MTTCFLNRWHLACISVLRPHVPQRCFSTSFRRSAPKPVSMEEFSCELIRNFSIIAHIDHGKSTLADRGHAHRLELAQQQLNSLQLTGTIKRKEVGKNEQVLDKLKVERERGITVKAQTARYDTIASSYVLVGIDDALSMMHMVNGRNHILNLIDTPAGPCRLFLGSLEVIGGMPRCSSTGVDASQGVQAQTISVFHIAQERGLKIIPVLNKIDLPAAQPERIAAQMEATFGTDPADIIQISAKTGKGVDQVLQAIIDRIPPPSGSIDRPLKAFLFDSMYDRYRGVVSLLAIQDGVLKKGDRIASSYTRKKYEVTDLGIMNPEEIPATSLFPGQVGFIACNMKESTEGRLLSIGASTISSRVYQHTLEIRSIALELPLNLCRASSLPKLWSTRESSPSTQVISPSSKSLSNGYVRHIFSLSCRQLIQPQLALTDRSVTVQRESSTALGQGSRLGFLGTLHMDVFRQRLEDEYDANIIVTAPTVPYKVVYRDHEVFISNPTEFPDSVEWTSKVQEVQEPIVKASIIVPEEYFGDMMDLCFTHRAEDLEHRYLDAGTGSSSRIILTCTLPLSEIVTDFFDQLKSRSSGFASFEYMAFLLNGKPVDALALVVHRSQEDAIGRQWVKKLVKVIPRQQFEVPIQAAVGKKIIARETLSAYRADVTAGLYGGHVERKMKVLERQKEGKRKMKRMGTVDMPQEAFFEIMSSKKRD
ncbi:unnamed protein product [Mycena citricolor]|uniref:Tr-type G domain-containing protein n=1 Tax=Mycena citricolor TaxID=2018698 RepID=A0AAD2HMH1_9AGAR|nr:unnamed protein product [Mycena citricolor]